jgi:aspartate racemase
VIGSNAPASLRGVGCHEPFETQAARKPDSVAVIDETGCMTYAELNGRANRLARELRALGARRGALVGIHLERSPEMLVAVLAVLKSGAAYVPLDPAFPRARLGIMLDDAAPVVLITTERLIATLPEHGARTLTMDQATWPDSSRERNVGDRLTSTDLAYVMYTSGSTGTPKGVMVTHGGVENYLAWRKSYFPLTPADRCLQKASLSFDDSVWEILEPLCAGASVVLARPQFEYDSGYLVKLIAEQRITAACFVPSLLHSIVDEPALESCKTLRRLTTGGETLSVALQRRVRERLPAARLYNGYGTTETTIASTFWQCSDDLEQLTVPIGRPIANTQVHVLDAQRQLVPFGVPGEIYISGAGVACGYLNRPTLTEERFGRGLIGVTSERWFRTGDLGRMRSDGVLEFLGRIDDQVKVRGVRVELAEIEAALLEHPNIRSAAVLYRDPGGSTGHMTAYFVPRGPAVPSAAGLREFVLARLPAAMVPNGFRAIAALPMTPSGKLDRRALAAMPDAPDDREVYVAPRDTLETQLVAIWETVLDARPIGARDDFFALGGQSLSAVRVAAAIEQTFGQRVPPGILFETPTIEALARRISTATIYAPRGSLVPLVTGGVAPPLFLIHQIAGDVILYRGLTRHLGAERSIYGLQAPGLADPERPLERVESMAKRYVEEIRALQPRGPYALAGHSMGGLIAFEMARQLHSVGERVAFLGLLDSDAEMRKPRTWYQRLRFRLDAVRVLPRTERGPYLRRRLANWCARVVETVRRRHRQQASIPLVATDSVRAAMNRALLAYRPGKYPGAATVFRARLRSLMTFGRTLNWGRLAQGGVQVIDVPGDHLSMLQEGAVAELAAKMNACLRKAFEVRGRLRR